MKKIGIINKLIIILLLFVPFVVSAKEVVKVYLFWGVGCPHCENAKAFFKEFEKEYSDTIELIEIEVSQNQNNSKLMSEVSEELGQKVTSVPYIVIGDKSFSGFSSALEPDLKDTIFDQYEKEDNIDIVGDIIEDKGYDISETSSSSVIIIMFLVIVLIAGTFYIFTKKS